MTAPGNRSMCDTAVAAQKNYAVVYTTYAWDAFVAAQFARNAERAASGDMYVLVDESHGAVAVPADCRRIVASEQAAKDLELRIAYHRALFWHNIDYLYYIFYAQHPDYAYYVFLDYDALINLDVDALIARAASQGIDYVGAPIDTAIEDWAYFDYHAGTYDLPDIEARISAVTILSNRAVAHLFTRRRQMSAAPTPAQLAFWPFCEAVVPTELKIAGFSSATLATFGDVQKFAWWPPTLDEALPAAPGFVHPVLDRPRFVASILKHSPTHEFLRPGTRLWRALRAARARDWLWLLAAEFGRRARRKAARRDTTPPAVSVGMRRAQSRIDPPTQNHRCRDAFG